MTRHLDDLELSDLIDDLPLAADVTAHAAQCEECRRRSAQQHEIRAESARERARTYNAPDPWPLIAALTFHRTTVRREVLRGLRLPLLAWTLTAFLLGVAATEAVRSISRSIAERSAEAALWNSNLKTR